MNESNTASLCKYNLFMHVLKVSASFPMLLLIIGKRDYFL